MIVEVGVGEAEAEGYRYKIEDISFVHFTVVGEIFEQKLLVGEFLMKLEMVESVLENFAVDAVIEIKTSVRLLPFEVEKQKFVIQNFFPVFPS